MAKKRNYKAEYARRIARAKKRGLSLSQARGHARSGENPIRRSRIARGDERLEAALTALRKSSTQVAAAKEAGVSVERFRRFLRENKLAKLKGRSWKITDNGPREMPVFSNGELKLRKLAGFDQASLNGKHQAAVQAFIRSSNLELLAPFVGQSVTDTNGESHPLETRANTLHAIMSAEEESYLATYRLIT